MRILSKVLAVCMILLVGCTPDRDAAVNRSMSRGTLVQQGTENWDGISYWNSTGSGGESRIVIDLDQQRAYFYKAAQIVGVSAVSTGREGYDTPSGEFRIMEKDREHVSSLYGNYVDQNGQLVMENVQANKDLSPEEQSSRERPCHTSSESMEASACTPVICPVIRRHMAVFGCPRQWHFNFFKMLLSALPWRFVTHRRITC
jgi:hypothetical protein